MGWNHDQEWHVYANSHNPEICPVLSLAGYIFSNPGAFSVSKDDLISKQDKDGEDGVDATVQRRDSLAPWLLLVIKDAFSLVTTSMVDSCHVCIGS